MSTILHSFVGRVQFRPSGAIRAVHLWAWILGLLTSRSEAYPRGTWDPTGILQKSRQRAGKIPQEASARARDGFLFQIRHVDVEGPDIGPGATPLFPAPTKWGKGQGRGLPLRRLVLKPACLLPSRNAAPPPLPRPPLCGGREGWVRTCQKSLQPECLGPGSQRRDRGPAECGNSP